MVEETVQGSSTPPVTGWQNLQINSYSKLGSSFKKTPRDPISQSLQLQKGMLTDEDSGIGFEVDITKHHIDRLAKSIYRCDPKHNGNKQQSIYKVEAVVSAGYQVPSNGDLTANTLVIVRGATTEENDGLKVVAVGSTGTVIHVVGGATAEAAPTNMTVEVCGVRFASGDANFDVDGNFNTLVKDLATLHLADFQFVYFGSDDTAHVFATEEFRGAAQVKKNGVTTHQIKLDRRSWIVSAHADLDLATKTTNDDTVVEAIAVGAGGNAITLAFVADGDPAAKAFLALATAHIDTVIQAKNAGVAGNLITVEIVAGAGAAAGVLTEIGTHVKLQYKATAVATTVAQLEALIGTSSLIEVKTAGTGATSLDGTDVSASRPLASGLDADAVTYGEVGSAITVHYSPGFSTVGDVEDVITSDSTLIRIKESGTLVTVLEDTVDEFTATNLAGGTSGADAGGGKTIDMYFGRYYRNVARNDDDFAKPTNQFEITFEELADNGDPEYWYPRGNALDETVINLPVTSKATMNCTFIGMRTSNPTVSRKTGPATALDANTSVGVSTSTDLARIRIDDTDAEGISTDFQSLKLTIKNNVSVQKQLAELGGSKIIHGQCMVSAEIGIIFTSDKPIRAVRDNRTMHLDVLVQNPDFGAMFDIHAFTLDSTDMKLEKNKSIMLDAKLTGFQDDKSGSTTGLTVFPYLPQRSTDDE